MPLVDRLERRAVGVGIEPCDRDDALRWFAARFEEAGVVDSADAAFAALVEREEIASTVLVEGVAVPHARVPGARRLAFGVMRVARPIAFGRGAADTVELLFAVIGPPEETAGHVALLAGIARLLDSARRRSRLLAAETSEALVETLGETGAQS